MNLMNCLGLSSAHLTSATLGQLHERGAQAASMSGWPQLVAPDAFGLFISVPESAPAGVPGDLRAVLAHARLVGADHVRLDATQPLEQRLSAYPHNENELATELALLEQHGQEATDTAFQASHDLRRAILRLMPSFEVEAWEGRPLRELHAALLPRRLHAPAYAIDYRFLADIAGRDVRIVDLRHAPYDVVFEGTEAALRAIYAEHWAGADWPGLEGEPAAT